MTLKQRIEEILLRDWISLMKVDWYDICARDPIIPPNKKHHAAFVYDTGYGKVPLDYGLRK